MSPPGKIPFLVSVDTEGDDLWSRPRAITTRNAGSLPRFQAALERAGLKPTYLVNHEMAASPAFRELARDVLARGQGEVGMHLHAWNTPPLAPLTDDDFRHHPYLVEYPDAVLREKVRTMTGILEEVFARKMVSHRAGRWAMSPAYARALADEGYLVDSSVTPHVSWRSSLGAPTGEGGSDYSAFPENPYYLDLDDLAKPGGSAILEIPMTTRPRAERLGARVGALLARDGRGARVLSRLAGRLEPLWLRPRGKNLADMVFLVERAIAEGRSNVQLMIHSSELMAGGSPTFKTQASIDALYRDLDALLDRFRGRLEGLTFAEFRARFA